MTASNERRAAFEAWWKLDGDECEVLSVHGWGFEKTASWAAWQAATAAARERVEELEDALLDALLAVTKEDCQGKGTR